jgi:hypothetical protein
LIAKPAAAEEAELGEGMTVVSVLLLLLLLCLIVLRVLNTGVKHGENGRMYDVTD